MVLIAVISAFIPWGHLQDYYLAGIGFAGQFMMAIGTIIIKAGVHHHTQSAEERGKQESPESNSYGNFI